MNKFIIATVATAFLTGCATYDNPYASGYMKPVGTTSSLTGNLYW